jgi:hypothetical protein
VVDGDSGDSVTNEGTNWTASGTQTINENVYNKYTGVGTGGTATLLVDQDITDQNVTGII